MTGDRPTLVLATTNQGKVAELVDLLGDRFDIVARPVDLPDTVEDLDTLVGNALKKAREIGAATGLAALADDTGLFVDALDGRPGVHTARYAGIGADHDSNISKLLGELAGRSDREAHFRTVVAVVFPDGRHVVGEGLVQGVIATERRGDRGFGYDPVFAPAEGDGRTFAQMTMEEKGVLSHRGRALSDLLAQL